MISILLFCSIQALTFAWEQDVKYFRVDDLGYVYTLDNRTLVKHDVAGDTLFVFSQMNVGAPSQLDVSNPLRPMLFYRETGSLLLLDNTLSEQRMLRLWETGVGLPEWVASGVNQEFWVYDALSKEVLRVNERMAVQARTGYLPASTGREPKVIGMAERHEQLILADASYGLWVFDRFGSLTKRIPVDNLTYMRAHASGVYLQTDHGPMWYNYGDIEPQVIENKGESNLETLTDQQNRRSFYLSEGKLEIIAQNAE